MLANLFTRHPDRGLLMLADTKDAVHGQVMPHLDTPG